jgi:cell division protein FtsI (penicillin-binding protein 3)
VKAQNHAASFIAWRFYVVVIFVLLVVTGLIARLLDLTIIDQQFLQEQSNARILRTLQAPAFRGIITDRNGYPLAVSTEVFSVWADPEDIDAKSDKIKSLADLLDLKVKDIQHLIQTSEDKGRAFIYLKREVSPEIAQAVKALKIPGINLQHDFKRFYPEGEVAAHVVGVTNIDGRGGEGLELAYNQWLSGLAGKRVVLKDRLGREVSELKSIQKQQAGNNLKLSIDRRIQYIAYRELMAGVEKNIAESGSVVILDVKTGEILAMVNQPSFNPNAHLTKKNDNLRNRAVTDVFEPGSTIKAFSIATALNSGLFKPDTIINTYPGWMRVEHHIVRDEHSKGPMTVTQILQISSNVGTSKMILQLPPNQLWEMLHKVGFGEVTGVGFPGERSGRLVNRPVWKPFAVATLSFGYGISVTALQLARAYATLANDGKKIPLSLLKIDQAPQGEQVIDKKIANQMITLLQSVVAKGGSGDKAAIPGYSVAGKTGTARIAGPHGYEEHHHISSFVGIAPASNPRFVVAVVMRDPKGKVYYGGDVSAPVFQKIMETLLRMYNISPDNLAAL